MRGEAFVVKYWHWFWGDSSEQQSPLPTSQRRMLMAHGDTSKNLALAMLSDLNKKMGAPRLLASLLYGLAFFFMPFFSRTSCRLKEKTH
jgi:hypothetical protein